jgi:hypothetical protein
MEGVENVSTPVPLVSGAPPVEAAYQSRVAPVEAVPESDTEPVPQEAPGVVVATVGMEFILASTAVLAADMQPVVLFLACAK